MTPGSSPRRIGDAHERRARELLVDAGWYVVRAAGSHGVADLVAMRGDHPPWLISCKAVRTPYLLPDEWRRLFTTALSVNAVPVICYRPALDGRRLGTAFVALMAETRGPHSSTAPLRPLDYR